MSQQTLPIVVFLVCLAASESDPQIDPEHVTTLEAMRGEETVAVIFDYQQADSRGWPTSVEHRRFVRFLQDSGLDVAFHFEERSGLHRALVAGSDAKRLVVLLEAAQEKGIPVPERAPPVGIAAGAGPELSWWQNAIFLIGTLAVLFWVFAVRDRPTSSWGS
jgi:hypothetical protein